MGRNHFVNGNLLIDNQYFPPDVKIYIINFYFSVLETTLQYLNYRKILLPDFIVPGFDWNYGLPSLNVTVIRCYIHTHIRFRLKCNFTSLHKNKN
jgi:hypothetical protein